MGRRQEIMENAEKALLRFVYPLAHPDCERLPDRGMEEKLCKCAEQLSMVIWNLSNSEELEEELTDEEVEDGIL